MKFPAGYFVIWSGQFEFYERAKKRLTIVVPLTLLIILLLLYLGYLALVESIDDDRRAAQAGAMLALVGAVNVPVIYFSVKWWNTLHQGASVSLTKAPSMATTMLVGMLVTTLAFWLYCIAVALARVRVIILERERHARWARQVLEPA